MISKKMKINFKVDDYTVNNHYMDKSVFINIMNKYFDNNYSVHVMKNSYGCFKNDSSDIIGISKRYEIDENNNIYFYIDFIDKIYEIFNVSMCFVGSLKDLNFNNECELKCLFLY